MSLNEVTSNPMESDEVAANPTIVWMRLHLTLRSLMKLHLTLLKSDEVASIKVAPSPMESDEGVANPTKV